MANFLTVSLPRLLCEISASQYTSPLSSSCLELQVLYKLVISYDTNINLADLDWNGSTLYNLYGRRPMSGFLDCSFASWQHLRSYQGRYRLVTACSWQLFKCCSTGWHWETRLPAQWPTCDSAHSWWLHSTAPLYTRPPEPWPDIPLSHNVPTLSQPVLAIS